MQDRISTYAGRVQLVPVSGQANVYDLTRADSPTQTGTPLNTATFLKNTTATKLGLTPATALPDDAINAVYDQCMGALAARLPRGIISIWYGTVATIPAGWVLCNGSNGTPDLRNRFVYGATESSTTGVTGGAASTYLTTTHLPSHTHTTSGLSINESGAHYHSTRTTPNTSSSGAVNVGGPTGSSWIPTDTQGLHTHTLSGSLGNTGGGASFSIMPPYRILCYIMKT